MERCTGCNAADWPAFGCNSFSSFWVQSAFPQDDLLLYYNHQHETRNTRLADVMQASRLRMWCGSFLATLASCPGVQSANRWLFAVSLPPILNQPATSSSTDQPDPHHPGDLARRGDQAAGWPPFHRGPARVRRRQEGGRMVPGTGLWLGGRLHDWLCAAPVPVHLPSCRPALSRARWGLQQPAPLFSLSTGRRTILHTLACSVYSRTCLPACLPAHYAMLLPAHYAMLPPAFPQLVGVISKKDLTKGGALVKVRPCNPCLKRVPCVRGSQPSGCEAAVVRYGQPGPHSWLPVKPLQHALPRDAPAKPVLTCHNALFSSLSFLTCKPAGCDVHSPHCAQGNRQGGRRSALHDRGALLPCPALQGHLQQSAGVWYLVPPAGCFDCQ